MGGIGWRMWQLFTLFSAPCHGRQDPLSRALCIFPSLWWIGIFVSGTHKAESSWIQYVDFFFLNHHTRSERPRVFQPFLAFASSCAWTDWLHFFISLCNLPSHFLLPSSTPGWMGFVILTVVFYVFVVTVFCEAHTLDVGGEGAFQLLRSLPL